jgi:hypothetical protein
VGSRPDRWAGHEDGLFDLNVVASKAIAELAMLTWTCAQTRRPSVRVSAERSICMYIKDVKRHAGGYFVFQGSADSTERDRGRAMSGAGRPDTARRPTQEANWNAKCLTPAGAGRYARAMEISPNWGNFPRAGVQVPLGHK